MVSFNIYTKMGNGSQQGWREKGEAEAVCSRGSQIETLVINRLLQHTNRAL